MAVGALVLGILSLVFAFFVVGFQWVGALIALVGIVLGAMGRRDPMRAGLATAGLVCSIIGLIFSLLLYIACVACVGGMAGLGLLNYL